MKCAYILLIISFITCSISVIILVRTVFHQIPFHYISILCGALSHPTECTYTVIVHYISNIGHDSSVFFSLKWHLHTFWHVSDNKWPQIANCNSSSWHWNKCLRQLCIRTDFPNNELSQNCLEKQKILSVLFCLVTWTLFSFPMAKKWSFFFFCFSTFKTSKKSFFWGRLQYTFTPWRCRKVKIINGK